MAPRLVAVAMAAVRESQRWWLFALRYFVSLTVFTFGPRLWMRLITAVALWGHGKRRFGIAV
jgi:hypothetical protein